MFGNAAAFGESQPIIRVAGLVTAG